MSSSFIKERISWYVSIAIIAARNSFSYDKLLLNEEHMEITHNFLIKASNIKSSSSDYQYIFDDYTGTEVSLTYISIIKKFDLLLQFRS